MAYPFPRTWWIQDGSFLGGPYPGTPDPNERTRMLAALVEAGFALVVNLQEADETGGGGKPFPDYSAALVELAAARGSPVETRRFPIRDGSVPKPEAMREILDKIDSVLGQGGKVYVHCWGGHGRTAMVAGCWMARHGVPPELALEQIARRRRHDAHLAKMPAPETHQQREFVRRWAAHDGLHTSPRKRKKVRTGNPAKLLSRTEGAADRAVGALVGLAAGDAVGTTVEFKAPGSFPPVTDMVGGGPFHLRPGEWTDDTSMALCLAESLIECEGFDPADQAARYCRWWKDGHFSVKGHCFDIGGTTSGALSVYLTTKRAYAGSTDPHSAGNGALMRLAPIPIAYANRPLTAIVLAGESSRTTHGAKESIDCCRYLAAILVGLINGRSKEEVLAPLYCPVAGTWDVEPLGPKVQQVAMGSFKDKQPPNIKGGGYVVDCLEAALWAFHSRGSFGEAVLAAANLGDDADTTAAVCGQVAGACYGKSGIPAKWRDVLAMRTEIESLGTALVSFWSSG